MRNRKGLTLVEVIVAMALFAIVMVTVFTAFLITNMMNNVSKEFSDATYEAQSQMELVYALSRDNTVNQTISDLQTNHGYTCVSSVCEKTIGIFDYEVRFTAHGTVSSITIIVVEVEANSGDYAGDRAKIENYLRFRAGG
jgi:prepilin-type N-terminal cleavage/methylation domain-containing protein